MADEIELKFLTDAGGVAALAERLDAGPPVLLTAAYYDTPDRRIFVGAILDCQALDQRYGISGSSSPPLPVTAYGKFFMTEPMDKQDGTIWVELVEVLEPGTPPARDVVRDTVQLYR